MPVGVTTLRKRLNLTQAAVWRLTLLFTLARNRKSLPMRQLSSIIALIAFLIAVALVAFLGANFLPGPWYEGLVKAPWTPPNWLFGPVWSVLYVAIAIAGWLVWRAGSDRRTIPLVLWAAQLVLNAAWSWLFFGMHRPDLALLDIILLLAVIFAFISRSRRVSPTASWLFVPYALWIAYATTLNLYVWLYNPVLGGS